MTKGDVMLPRAYLGFFTSTYFEVVMEIQKWNSNLGPLPQYLFAVSHFSSLYNFISSPQNKVLGFCFIFFEQALKQKKRTGTIVLPPTLTIRLKPLMPFLSPIFSVWRESERGEETGNQRGEKEGQREVSFAAGCSCQRVDTELLDGAGVREGHTSIYYIELQVQPLSIQLSSVIPSIHPSIWPFILASQLTQNSDNLLLNPVPGAGTSGNSPYFTLGTGCLTQFCGLEKKILLQ